MSLYDINIMTTSNYGFTIKCIKSGAQTTEGELAGTMYQMALFHKGHVSEYYYETDSLNRLHIHGIMQARKGLLLTRFKKQFWHIHIDPLKTETDLKNWKNYIKKEDINFVEWISQLRNGDNKFQSLTKNISLDG